MSVAFSAARKTLVAFQSLRFPPQVRHRSLFCDHFVYFSGRRPPETGRVDGDGRPAVLGALDVLLHQFGSDADHVLPLPVLDHVERLQRADDVVLCDRGHLAANTQKSGFNSTGNETKVGGTTIYFRAFDKHSRSSLPD